VNDLLQQVKRTWPKRVTAHPERSASLT